MWVGMASRSGNPADVSGDGRCVGWEGASGGRLVGPSCSSWESTTRSWSVTAATFQFVMEGETRGQPSCHDGQQMGTACTVHPYTLEGGGGEEKSTTCAP